MVTSTRKIHQQNDSGTSDSEDEEPNDEKVCLSMYLSMYVCIYLSIYVSIYVYVYVCMYVCIYLSIRPSNTNKEKMTQYQATILIYQDVHYSIPIHFFSLGKGGRRI